MPGITFFAPCRIAVEWRSVSTTMWLWSTCAAGCGRAAEAAVLGDGPWTIDDAPSDFVDGLCRATTLAEEYKAARNGLDANRHHIAQAHLLTCDWAHQGGGSACDRFILSGQRGGGLCHKNAGDPH